MGGRMAWNRQSRLRTILRSALLTQGRKLSEYKTLFQDLVSLLLPKDRFPITGQWNEVLDNLLQNETDVMLLPKEMDSTVSPGKAILAAKDAANLLRKIGKLVVIYEKNENSEYLETCRQLTEQILNRLSPAILSDVLEIVSSEKIIDGIDCPKNRRSLFSVEELRICRKANLLFLFSQGTTDEQRRGSP